MELVYSLGYILLLGGGGIMSLYLYKSNFKASGQFFGVSSLSLGLVGLISSFLGIDGGAYRAIWIAFGFSVVGIFFIEFRRPKAVLFLALPFYVLVLTFMMSLPFLVLFAILALEVGILDAYLFSRLDFTAFARVVAGDKFLRVLLAPFSVTGLSMRRVFRGQPSKAVLFLSYSLLPIGLLLVVFLLWWFVDAGSAYFLVIATSAYLAVATNKFIKGTKYKDSSL